MKVSELRSEHVGRRLRVTKVAVGDAERLGYINDTERLLGQEGTLLEAREFQADVDWDGEEPGSLFLAHDDEVELLPDFADADWPDPLRDPDEGSGFDFTKLD